MTKLEAARLIDISAVRTQHCEKDILEVVEIAKRYNFINVHTLPSWTETVSKLLKGFPDIYVGAPVGFPSGGSRTEIKLLEAKYLVEDCADEIDIVMNVGKFKAHDYDYVKKELDLIISSIPQEKKTKVIIELNCLEDNELESICDLIADTNADFLKTGTGWIPGNANIERIEKIKKYLCGRKMVKAAGGIRTRNEFDALLNLGVERFGINTKSALEIVESYDD